MNRELLIDEAKLAIKMDLTHVAASIRIINEMCDHDLSEYASEQSKRIFDEVNTMDDDEFLTLAEHIR